MTFSKFVSEHCIVTSAPPAIHSRTAMEISNAVLASIGLPLILLFVIYKYLTYHFDYWKLRNVPYEKPIPGVGNFGFLFTKSGIPDYFLYLYNKYRNEDYYGIWVFRKPVLVVQSAELAKSIFVRNFDHFRERLPESAESDPLGALNLFCLKGPRWSIMRHRVGPIFSTSKLRHVFANTVTRVTHELVDHIKNLHADTGKAVQLKELCGLFTLEVIGNVAFGLKTGSMQNPNAPLRTSYARTITYTIWRTIEMTLIFFVPSLVGPLRCKFFTAESSDYLRKLFWKVLDERERAPKTDKITDLVDVLVQLRKEPVHDGVELTGDLLLAQMAVFFFAGYESSSTTMTYTLFHLAHRPALQERLYQEIVEVSKTIEGEITYDDLNKFPLLENCIKESLRSYPVLAEIDRICTKDFQLTDTLKIEKGTPVFINLMALHYNEEYFPDPYTWDPDRFSEERKHTIHPYAYLPFGEGPHNCIGARFAMMQIKSSLLNIIRKFKVVTTDKTISVKELEFNHRNVLTCPEQSLYVEFLTR